MDGSLRSWMNGRSTRWMVLCLGVMGLWSCGQADGKASQTPKAPVVASAPAQVRTMVRTVDVTGETIAVNRVAISSTVDGRISFSPWREGDKVSNGERLVEIDREVYRAEVMVAEAAVISAEAKLRDMESGTRIEEIIRAEQNLKSWEDRASLARSEYERARGLADSGAISEQELERRHSELTSAEASLEESRSSLQMLRAGYTRTAMEVQEAAVGEARAHHELAKARLNEAVISAPFDGVVTRVMARYGDLAVARAGLLELVDSESLVVRCAVPESEALSVREGIRAHVVFDAMPGRRFEGEVVRVFPELHERLRTRVVELKVSGTEPLPGMFARVAIELESFPEALAIPSEAVRSTNGKSFVYVVDGAEAVRREVVTGVEHDGFAQVLSGVTMGEEVVTRGLTTSKPRVAISRPAETDAAGAPKQ